MSPRYNHHLKLLSKILCSFKIFFIIFTKILLSTPPLKQIAKSVSDLNLILIDDNSLSLKFLIKCFSLKLLI